MLSIVDSFSLKIGVKKKNMNKIRDKKSASRLSLWLGHFTVLSHSVITISQENVCCKMRDFLSTSSNMP